MTRYTLHEKQTGRRHWDSYINLSDAEEQLRQSYSPSRETLEIRTTEAEVVFYSREGAWALWSDGELERFYSAAFSFDLEKYDNGLSSVGGWSVDRIEKSGANRLYLLRHDRSKATRFTLDPRSAQREVSPAAKRILDAWYGSDSARADIHLPNGIKDLLEITEAVETIVMPADTRPGGYAGHEITRLDVTLKSGARAAYFVRTQGYSEGYEYAIFDSLKGCQKWQAGWCATECLECGATYNQPGHVEPGEMGCDRCG